jgi:6-pyruvoyltetrahydropterin/6-carboxytetrahydropterin synthase
MTITLTPFHGWVLQWSSSHFYENPQWDNKKNQEVFGLCSNPEGHGHNYKLEVLFSFKQEDTLRTKGTLGRLKELLDHKNLKKQEAFQNRIPTTENLALWIYDYLKKELDFSTLELKLYETDSLWIELKSEEIDTFKNKN